MHILIMVIALLLIFPAPSFAYLDPATGSMIIQGIIGAVAGLFVAVKLYWGKVTSFFSRKDKTETSDEKNPT